MAYDERDLAYLAGITDADGSFNVCLSQARIALKVGMIDTGAVTWLLDTFGGHIWVQKTALGKDFHVWNLVDRKQLIEVVRLIRPYLRVKGPQADALITLLEHCAARPVRRRGNSQPCGHNREYMRHLDYRFREYELRRAVQEAR